VQSQAPAPSAAVVALNELAERIRSMSDRCAELQQRAAGLSVLVDGVAAARALVQKARDARTAAVAAQLARGQQASLARIPAEVAAERALQQAQAQVDAAGGDDALAAALHSLAHEQARLGDEIARARESLPRRQRDVVLEQLDAEGPALRDALSALASRMARVAGLTLAHNALAKSVPGAVLLYVPTLLDVGRLPNAAGFRSIASQFDLQASATALSADTLAALDLGGGSTGNAFLDNPGHRLQLQR
jgi:hypothetical protein